MHVTKLSFTFLPTHSGHGRNLISSLSPPPTYILRVTELQRPEQLECVAAHRLGLQTSGGASLEQVQRGALDELKHQTEAPLPPEDLQQVDEVFVTQTLWGKTGLDVQSVLKVARHGQRPAGELSPAV